MELGFIDHPDGAQSSEIALRAITPEFQPGNLF